MTGKSDRRRRRTRGIVIGLVTAGVLIVILALAACGGGSKHSSMSPAAKASAKATASQIAQGVKHGQAAQQAEKIVQDCFRQFSGGPGLLRCILPHATHRKVFDKCAIRAQGADIPGQEIKFVQTDLPNCLVAAR